MSLMSYIRFFPNLLTWWYSQGVITLFNFLGVFFMHWTQVFSPANLLLNIFSPWKRLTGVKGRGLDALRDWLVDNFVARTVGFVMRIAILFIYLIFVAFYIIFFVISISAWFLMPGIIIFAFIFIFES